MPTRKPTKQDLNAAHMEMGKTHIRKAHYYAFGYNTLGRLMFFHPGLKNYFGRKIKEHNAIAENHFREAEKNG